jgi:hypothetical protein
MVIILNLSCKAAYWLGSLSQYSIGGRVLIGEDVGYVEGERRNSQLFVHYHYAYVGDEDTSALIYVPEMPKVL